MAKRHVRYIMADWKEDPATVFGDTMKQVNTILRRKGLKIHIKPIDFLQGSDTYGWMLGLEKLTTAEARAISNKDYHIDGESEAYPPDSKQTITKPKNIIDDGIRFIKQKDGTFLATNR